MNRSRIEWTDFTWNPVVGCSAGCGYCYARRLAKPRGKCSKCRDFKPHLHPERLDDPVRRTKPAKIFVCSMGELFDPSLPASDTRRVADGCYRAGQHTYQLLTKRPARMAWALGKFQWPRQVWAGVSVDRSGYNAVRRIVMVKACDVPVKFISFEPLLAEIRELPLGGIDWVIIGSQTGPGAKKPEIAWVRSIIAAARKNRCAVFLKDNLNWPEKIQEWPAGYGE